MKVLKHILVPVDFSECSVAALQHARSLSDVFGAKLDVIHTYDVPSFITPNIVVFAGNLETPLADHADRQARDQLLEFLRKHGLGEHPNVHARVVMGPPGSTILDVAETERPDLLVIGTHGRTGMARVLLGSTAEKVLRGAPCPVLAVKAESAHSSASSASPAR